ncbi:uncharacterized protein LOC105694252 [Orussus abietinus]|uniref:uncharacterized protein LOC105694252 n=1 Tax=Orussus abietinus TaxID=222816 RepID=UPI0006260237|nr:uncharacterized protein LOC105694252 [Orussus abietinus]
MVTVSFFHWAIWSAMLCSVFYFVTGGKQEMAVEAWSDSWISEENFTTMVKHSFRFSRCCNVYLNGSTSGINALFRRFINIYPYEYLVERHTYDCQGYFLLASTEEQLVDALTYVPSKISTTELLIIVDSTLEEDSMLFDVDLYNNADANLASPSGIWSLSANYLRPRMFKKMKRYKELIYDKRIVNFNGRLLQASSFYNPPFTYMSKTVNKTYNGAEVSFFLADDDTERDGIEMQIFMLMAEKLNFTWMIRRPLGRHRYGREVNDTFFTDGMIGMIIEKEVDIAFSSIWLKTDHYKFANLSEAWYQLYIGFLVPRPKLRTSFWALTRPFTVEVWLGIVAMLILKSSYLYTRAWINPKMPRRYRNCVVTMTELMGRLVGTWTPTDTESVRMQLHLWQIAGLLVVTAYCSSLAASLASSEYEERIDNVRQFLKANLTWSMSGATPRFGDYFDFKDPFESQMPSKFVYHNSDEERQAAVKRGNQAIFGKLVGKLFFPDVNITNEELKNYRLMRQKVGTYYACFAVQPWLLEPISTLMLWLREGGITIFHQKDVIRRRVKLSLREVLKEQDKSDGVARVLALTPLGAGFSFLIFGLFVSTVVFYLELRSGRKSRSNPRMSKEKLGVQDPPNRASTVPAKLYAEEIFLGRKLYPATT